MTIILPAQEPAFYRDAFGRSRVSEPFTIFDSNFITDDRAFFFDNITDGSGALTRTSSCYMKMTCTASASDRVVMQSKRYCNYQPRKSFQWTVTGVLETSGGVSGGVVRAGVFDDINDWASGGDGTFFELDGTTLYVCVRSSVSGSQVYTDKVAQSAWNGDRLDGSLGVNNPSGITLDVTKTNIYAADVEWLGVGSVRFYVIIDGYPYLVHTAHHANDTLQVPYMKRATLPVRWEITGTASGATESRFICCEVESEGGFNPTGKVFSVGQGTGSTAVTGTALPLCSVRLSSANCRVAAQALSFSIVAGSKGVFYYQAILNGSLTGASFATYKDTSLQVDTAATAINTTSGTSAHRIQAGYFTQETGAAAISLGKSAYLTSLIDGTSDILTIVATKPGGGATVNLRAMITLRELD